MEISYQTIIRIIITGVLATSAFANNFLQPPLPYFQNGFSSPWNQMAKVLPPQEKLPNQFQPPYQEQIQEDFDYLLPTYPVQENYNGYDFAQGQTDNIYGYNYQGLYDLSYDYRPIIQIIPPRFPQPIERIIESIQNFFSTYNYPYVQYPTYIIPSTTSTSTTTTTTTTSPSTTTQGYGVENSSRPENQKPLTPDSTTINPTEETEFVFNTATPIPEDDPNLTTTTGKDRRKSHRHHRKH